MKNIKFAVLFLLFATSSVSMLLANLGIGLGLYFDSDFDKANTAGLSLSIFYQQPNNTIHGKLNLSNNKTTYYSLILSHDTNIPFIENMRAKLQLELKRRNGTTQPIVSIPHIYSTHDCRQDNVTKNYTHLAKLITNQINIVIYTDPYKKKFFEQQSKRLANEILQDEKKVFYISENTFENTKSLLNPSDQNDIKKMKQTIKEQYEH